MTKNGKFVKVPGLGRFLVAPDTEGSALHNGGLEFNTHLHAKVIRKGEAVEAKKVWSGHNFAYKMTHLHDDPTVIDLGTGLVTNIGAQAIANEAITLASPSGARINTLFLANQHATGTGTTAAAATDLKIETISTNGGQTPVAGTQTTPSTATGASPKYRTVATISYTGSEAVTEWGLFTSSTLSATTGSPFTAATATTFTATSTPFTASSSTVQGLQQSIVIPGTTTVYGFIQSNTTSVATLNNNGTTGWFTQAAGAAGSTPGNTETYVLRPIMWDHKVFSAVNVANGDSIQFTYTLTVTSGG